MSNALATAESLNIRLTLASENLASVRTDFERIQIRDMARAVEAASAILKRKDIQVQAANLVQDAERAIVKANPPKVRGPAVRQPLGAPTGSPKPGDVRKMRQAHGVILDSEYEAMQADAVTSQQPLTRQQLTQAAQEKKAAASDADTLFTRTSTIRTIFDTDAQDADTLAWVENIIDETLTDYLEHLRTESVLAPTGYLQDVLGQDWVEMLDCRYKLDFDDAHAETDEVLKQIATGFLMHSQAKATYASLAPEPEPEPMQGLSTSLRKRLVETLTSAFDEFVVMTCSESKLFRQLVTRTLQPDTLELDSLPDSIQHNWRALYHSACHVLDILENGQKT